MVHFARDTDRLSVHATAGSRRANDEPRSPDLRTIVPPSEPLPGRQNKSELRFSCPFPPHHEAMNRHKRSSSLLSVLWVATAVTSFSSSLLAGALLAPHASQGSGYPWRESPHSLHEEQDQCLEKVLLSQSRLGLEALPPLPRTMSVLHIFCLSTLALHRSRKSDRYQNETISLLVLIGLNLGLCTLPTEPCRNAAGAATMILPTLISISTILSAVLHILYIRWTDKNRRTTEQESWREEKG